MANVERLIVDLRLKGGDSNNFHANIVYNNTLKHNKQIKIMCDIVSYFLKAFKWPN